jgi:sterol-4alpha-carboxylate 3-dehydrogenase (decarboxylating)
MALSKVLVTGGTGFLGSEIVKALVETKRHEITVVDINPPALGTGSFFEVRYVRANVLQPEELHKVFQEAKPTIVVHTVGVYRLGAARYTQKGRETVFEVNIQGTQNVVDAAKECGARGLVFASTVAVLVDEIDADFRNVDETWPTGRAKLPYGQSKVMYASSPTEDFN